MVPFCLFGQNGPCMHRVVSLWPNSHSPSGPKLSSRPSSSPVRPASAHDDVPQRASDQLAAAVRRKINAGDHHHHRRQTLGQIRCVCMAVPFKRGSMHNTCKPGTSVSIDLSIWGMQSCSGFVHLTPIRTTEESNT